MRLGELCRGVAGARVPAAAAQLRIRAVRDDSREIEPGDVFVAVPGEDEDGREHAERAVEKGAVVVVSQTPLELPVPVVLVPDARLALARMGAERQGRPADRLQLVGITGTVGKTSVLAMLSAVLEEAGVPAGSIGSLGIHHPGGSDHTPNTTPGALPLQRAMAEMVDAGTRVAAMEVTSHALLQERVHGLTFDLGIFTNLTMLEHMEYHGSFRAYAGAKRLFLQYLAPDAPLVYAAGDRVVRNMVAAHTGPRVGCGSDHAAEVFVERRALDMRGARLTVHVQQPLPRLDAEPLQPLSFPLELAALGRTNVANATIAAVAALCLGASPDAVRSALRRLEPPRRRTQVIRAADPCIIDDTVGHPDSITGVFEVAEQVPHRRLVVVFCVRGQRGATINRRDAEALCIWSRRVPVAELVITSATDTADERNAVTGQERSAFTDVLEQYGVGYTHHDRLVDAVSHGVSAAGAGDLLLLLGAQGMDEGARLALSALGRERPAEGRRHTGPA